MNLLSHLYLSFGEPTIMVGNLLGDDVRGGLDELDSGVRRGVQLHRLIDSSADSHPAFLRAAKLLSPNWRHWSRVIIDVAFDHVLARQWDRWSDDSLREYLDRSYELMYPERSRLSSPHRARLERLIESDLLWSWRSEAGVETSLRRISIRSKRKPQLADAMADLRQFDDRITAEFEVLFPALADQCRDFLKAS